MARTKISEFSSTPANNTDIDSINIAEGCAPSNINDAIRELMAQLKDFQIGSQGDSFNGPIGTTTAAAGAFTTLSASSTVTLSGGTANGVTYLNGSKVLTSGSALTFDGTRLGVGTASPDSLGLLTTEVNGNSLNISRTASTTGRAGWFSQNTAETIRLFSEVYGASATNTGFGLTLAGYGVIQMQGTASNGLIIGTGTNDPLIFGQNDTEGMRLTSTGLGIGTSSPAVKLDVNGSGRFRGFDSGYYNENVLAIGNASYDPKIGLASNGGYRWNTRIADVGASGAGYYVIRYEEGSLDTVTIARDGNLGLGVTPSAWGTSWKALEVGGKGSSFFSLSAGDNTYLTSNAYFNGTNWIYAYTSNATAYNMAGGVHKWLNAPSGTAGNAISFTQAMTLDASGNLGVGTTSPAYKINVVEGKTLTPTTGDGQIAIDNSTSGQVSAILFSSQGTRRAQISAGLGGTGNDGYLAFTTRNDTTGFGERARIDSSGNLLVGTTSNPASGKTYIGVVFNGQTEYGSTFKTSYSSGIACNFLNSSGTQVGKIDTNTTSTTYATSSDYRLKNSVAPMIGALARVAALKPVTYKWNADGSDGEGFIAHELAEVCPHAVTGEKDAVDEDGNPKYQGIDTSFLVATLTAAIQEQQAIIESLKARLDAANL